MARSPAAPASFDSPRALSALNCASRASRRRQCGSRARAACSNAAFTSRTDASISARLPPGRAGCASTLIRRWCVRVWPSERRWGGRFRRGETLQRTARGPSHEQPQSLDRSSRFGLEHRDGRPAQTCWGLQHAMRVASNQRDASQLHHVTVDGLAEWIAWWDAQEAIA